MAKALWEQPITKNDDWGGGDFSGGAPVSGKYVQQFIKESLNKKFGYLYYNKDAVKYYVFADQDDYNKWYVNPSGNADLVLATFDAPAPATIKTKTLPKVSPESVTMLFGTTITPVVFHYYVEDNSGNAVSEDVIMRITATSKSSVKSEVITIPYDLKTYKKTEAEYAVEDTENKYGYNVANSNPIGTRYEYNRLNRLLTTADNYSIVITLTGATTQVSTTLAFEYQLIDLSIATDFNYLSSIKDTDDEFIQNITVKGAEGFAKIFSLKVDGYDLIQDSTTLGIVASRILSSGNSLGDSATINKQLEIFMHDKNKNALRWPDTEEYEGVRNELIFGPGKHTLELSAHINLDATGTEIISSKTLYFNFVVASEGQEQTFLLYQSELNSAYQQGEKIKLEGTQYSQIEYAIGVFTTQNRSVPVKYVYKNSAGTTINDITHSVRNGEVDEIKYTLREEGTIDLTISAYDSTDNVIDSIEIQIKSNPLAGVTIAETTTNNIFKFSAENRSNNDPDRETWSNTSKAYGSQYTQAGVLNNVNFNDLNGWDGTSLILRNNATVTFPFNLFNLPVTGANENSAKGFTFEIDFETMNVQDDDAIIMDFADRDEHGYLNYNSYITIKATSAEMSTKNGSKIKTNFKEAERIKLAFIVNPLKNTINNAYDPDNIDTDDNPNTLFIMVNGVLDRVVKYGTGSAGTDTMKWENPIGSNASSFTIGNTDGKAAVKINSIRIYDRALTLDEEFMNYMNDQTGDELIETFEKNNIVSDNAIDFDKVRKLIPTMIMGIDYISFGSFDATRKKDNTFAEVQFFMPPTDDQNLNFYARQCWVSCQGTSSMSYPVKNLRLYFCKGKNKVTFQEIRSLRELDANSQYVNTTTNDASIITPEYETEFWTYSEYKADYADKLLIGTTDIDSILPYATNKKVDGPDGSMIVVGRNYINAIHEGYHKIGANRTMKGKIALVKKYLDLQELDPTDINFETYEIKKKAITFYTVDPNKSPIIVKNAFDKNFTIYSTLGFEGYLKNADNTYAEKYEEHKYDAFTDKWTYTTEVNNESTTVTTSLTDYLKSIKNDNSKIEAFLIDNDLFISAFRPILRTGEDLNSDSYKTLLDELRYSGVKLYYYDAKKKTYKAHKKDLNDATIIGNGHNAYENILYSLGANWRQYDDHNNEHGYGKTHISGWTDRWTLKADYAESSNTHNGGIGRLWGNAMYNVSIDNEFKCRTDAQSFVNGAIDIRTSCDCRPIVLFYKQIQQFDDETGLPIYAEPRFAGLYNIMTDKGSTKLFGFENITNPAGKKWEAYSDNPEDNRCTECWECLNNGSDIIKGLSTAFDEKGSDGEAVSGNASAKDEIGVHRPLWGTYEARWPDTGQERHAYSPADNPLGNNWADDVYGVDTKNLEGFLRWVNFCKDAVHYRIGKDQEMDGYVQNIYVQLTNIEAGQWHDRYLAAEAIYTNAESSPEQKEAAAEEMKKCTLYKKWEKSGNTVYSPIGDTYEYVAPDPENEGKDKTYTAEIIWQNNEATVWYRYNYEINMEIVTKTANTEKIGHKVYVVGIPSFDAKYRCTGVDGVYNEEEARKYLVDTYVWPTGSGDYQYYDNYGELKTGVSAASIDLDTEKEHMVTLSAGTSPVSCQNITYFQYFKATKKDHLDLEKVAAYYIYLLRFGAVDQVVKNSMMTTEDGKHYYFINYDNDTILGVRNDGYLIYNWDIDRNSYDASLPGYAFAGAQSVLWNCLEMDDEFMALVKTIDNAMNKQGLLSAEAVLTWLNERQEGTWSQRLYNEQEKVKYLSTVKKDFTTDKYLGFMHGTRHSHRNWWVNHRWELYDAKWSSGMYSLKQMSFIYTLIAGAKNPQDMMITTAASKYYFTLIRNTALSYSDWFKELGREETGVFTIRQSNSVGDPIFFYGPQKLKVLNLRPNADKISRISLAEAYTIIQSDGSKKTSDWVDDDGSMMTKLLIGYDDEHVASTATDISGLNKLYSLEEVDIRGMQNLNGGVPVISNLSNLHRWRAKNSNATSFIPAKGVTLYEVSLGAATTTIILNGVEFKEDTNKYQVYQDKAVSGNSSIGATLGTRYGDILPVYTDPKAYKYCKTYGWDVEKEEYVLIPQFEKITTEIEGEVVETGDYTGKYVFDYAPTDKLTSVTFNNVKGIDTYQFLVDLKAALLAGNKDTKTCNVNITGFEWVIDGENAVADFIQMHKTFNYTDSEGVEQFGGSVYFNKTLNETEYNALIAEFGKDVFKPDNIVTVNCKEGTLMNITGGKEKEVTISGNAQTVYEIVQGAELKIMASIFPISEDNRFVYQLTAIRTWTTAPGINMTGTKGNEVFTMVQGINEYATLTNKDSEATFIANPEFELDSTPGLGENQYFIVNVCRYLPDGRIDSNNPIAGATTYIKVQKRKQAKDNEVEIYDVTNSETGTQMAVDGSSIIADGETHTFEVRYKTGVDVNVDVKSLTVSFDDSVIQHEAIRTINDESGLAAEIFDVENGIDNENQKYKFKIKHYITKFITNPNLTVYVNMTLTSGKVYRMVMNYNVSCKYATRLDLYDGDTLIGSNAEINITAIGKYTYKLQYDVEPNIKYTLSINNMPNIEGCTVSIDNENSELNVNVGVVKTTNIPNNIGILARPEVEVPGYITDLTLERVLSVNISYPDKLEMTCAHPLLTANLDRHVNSNLETYSDEFAFNITNNTPFDGSTIDDVTYPKVELKIKALDWDGNDVNMSYSTELYSIKVGENTPSSITQPTEENVHEDSEHTGYYLGGDISVDIESGDAITFTPKYKKVTLDTVEVFSLVSLIMSTGAKQNKNITTTVKIACKVRYDSDANTTAEETPYFDFSLNGGASRTKIVEFTMTLTRSLCVATTYDLLRAIGTPETEYIFYAVDKYNRFFEVTATENSGNFTVRHEFTAADVIESGVENTGLIGCGFVAMNGVQKCPIFLSFTQFIGFSLGSTTGDEYNIGEYGSTAQRSASSTDLYNGYNITSKFVEDASHAQSIFARVYNYNYPIKMYVPSLAELRQIAVASGAIVPSKVAQALNAVMNTLVIEGLAVEMKVYNDAQNYYTEEDKRRIQGGNAVFADVVKYTNVVGTVESRPDNVFLQFISATNNWGNVTEGIKPLSVKTIRCMRADGEHSLVDSTINQTQYADNKFNVTLPFIHVG